MIALQMKNRRTFYGATDPKGSINAHVKVGDIWIDSKNEIRVFTGDDWEIAQIESFLVTDSKVFEL